MAVDRIRSLRNKAWMKNVGDNREKLVTPQPLGETERAVAKIRGRCASEKEGVRPSVLGAAQFQESQIRYGN